MGDAPEAKVQYGKGYVFHDFNNFQVKGEFPFTTKFSGSKFAKPTSGGGIIIGPCIDSFAIQHTNVAAEIHCYSLKFSKGPKAVGLRT